MTSIFPSTHRWGESQIQICEALGRSRFFNNFFSKGPVTPHTIVTLPNTNGMQLLLCYDNEGVYVNTYGKV